MGRRLVLLALALAAACGSNAETPTSAGDDTTSTSTTTEVTEPTSTSTSTTTTVVRPPGPPATGSETTGGIQLELTVEHGEVDVGTRLWADLVITNVGEEIVYWQAGGCSIPASITLASADGAPPFNTEPWWDGDPATFRSAVVDHNNLVETRHFDHEPSVGWQSWACQSDSRMSPLQPGEQLRQRGAADVRIGIGEIPSGGRYLARAAFVSYANPEDYGYQETDQPRPEATVDVPVLVREVDRRTDGDAAVIAFGGVDALAAFIEDTHVSTVANTWSTTLSWWRDAWELWVKPKYSEGGSRSLRLRYDPARDEVVDVRVVWDEQPPEDDPDARQRSGHRPDDVRPTD